MELSREMAGPYVRALKAGVNALAPNQQQVPLAELVGHLTALDPAHTFDLFAPFTVDPVSGLPDFAWMERVTSELSVLGQQPGRVWSRQEIDQAERMEPALAHRLMARKWLLGQRGAIVTLPSSRLQIRFRHRGARERVLIQLDKMVPAQGWVRLQLDAEGVAGWGRGLWVESVDGMLAPSEGLLHLCSRHIRTPLTLLHRALERQLEVWIPVLSRGSIGPFWYPGGRNVGAPNIFEGSLALHMSMERLGTDSSGLVHRDPWLAPVKSEMVPAGYGVFRERRFAVSASHVVRVRQWADSQGSGAVVCPLDSL